MKSIDIFAQKQLYFCLRIQCALVIVNSYVSCSKNESCDPAMLALISYFSQLASLVLLGLDSVVAALWSSAEVQEMYQSFCFNEWKFQFQQSFSWSCQHVLQGADIFYPRDLSKFNRTFVFMTDWFSWNSISTSHHWMHRKIKKIDAIYSPRGCFLWLKAHLHVHSCFPFFTVICCFPI